jgi:hypothetical protein
MAHEVNVVLGQEVVVDDPGCVPDDLVHPFAVDDGLVSLGLSHDRLPLVLVRKLIVAHANNKVRIREGLLCLLQRSGVAVVEHVEDAVCVEAQRATVAPLHGRHDVGWP